MTKIAQFVDPLDVISAKLASLKTQTMLARLAVLIVSNATTLLRAVTVQTRSTSTLPPKDANNVLQIAKTVRQTVSAISVCQDLT